MTAAADRFGPLFGGRRGGGPAAPAQEHGTSPELAQGHDEAARLAGELDVSPATFGVGRIHVQRTLLGGPAVYEVWQTVAPGQAQRLGVYPDDASAQAAAEMFRRRGS